MASEQAPTDVRLLYWQEPGFSHVYTEAFMQACVELGARLRGCATVPAPCATTKKDM